MRAAVTEPGPVMSEYKPDMSFITPILTMPSEICAWAEPAKAQAATAARERSLRFIVLSPVRKKSHAQVLMQHAHLGGQLLRAEGLHHLAMLHHVKPIRQGRGKPEVLFHHDDREALGLEGLDHAG